MSVTNEHDRCREGSMESNVTGSFSWIDKLIGRDETHTPDDPYAQGMGDCAEIHDNASDFIDGEVPSNLTARIRHHLGLCNDCNGWMTSRARTHARFVLSVRLPNTRCRTR
jgi:hypothetical protein